MKIVIVGPGAVGCLFAGFLSEAGHDVVLLDRNEARAKLVSERGIFIESARNVSRIPVMAVADPRAIGTAGMICLCVKSYDTAQAARHALPTVGRDTIILSVQNGADNAERIRDSVPGAHIVCCVTAHGAGVIEPGRIRHAGTGPTQVASFPPTHAGHAERAARLLTESGIETSCRPDCLSLVWGKLVANAGINPLTATANVRNGQILKDPALRRIFHAAVREAAATAKAKGIRLSYPDEVAEAEDICRATANNLSSMLQDVMKGRRTEIDSINGVVVRTGREFGIPVPVNERLVSEIHLIEEKTGAT